MYFKNTIVLLLYINIAFVKEFSKLQKLTCPQIGLFSLAYYFIKLNNYPGCVCVPLSCILQKWGEASKADSTTPNYVTYASVITIH